MVARLEHGHCRVAHTEWGEDRCWECWTWRDLGTRLWGIASGSKAGGQDVVGGDFGLSCSSCQFSSMSVGGKAEDFVSGGGLGTLPIRRQLETAGAGAGQAGCSALLLLLLPRPKGWVIFRFKYELCLVSCESSPWDWELCVPAEFGDILRDGKKHQSQDLWFWLCL